VAGGGPPPDPPPESPPPPPPQALSKMARANQAERRVARKTKDYCIVFSGWGETVDRACREISESDRQLLDAAGYRGALIGPPCAAVSFEKELRPVVLRDAAHHKSVRSFQISGNSTTSSILRR
jgi:hypothetical protein